MFLLTISVGRIWSVQSDLELSAIKKNLRIMSDIERVFWTVLLRMASRVFLFFTSYSRCKVGLRGFLATLLSVAEMVNEA